MLRRIVALLSATLVAGAMSMLAPTSPASAAEVCGGVGNATVGGDGLYYPGGVFGGYRTQGFSFTLNVAGLCVPSLSAASALGTVQGYCGHSTGVGQANGTYDFWWTSAGSFLVVTGELTGVVAAVPDAVFAAQSCTTGALAFIVAGAVYASNACTQLALTELLTTIVANLSVHTSIHPCAGI